ncbi:MAG: hypothetical protein A2231_03715 [Candidatus Firestonebacteria bacterium RIFOXYA2_FULL_40_8]|nr:MAG: hypothetical protein A2231_03715 [Candidatus Firestonebacteria bacterium RIFOXYA2_FULL_40_8]
MKKVFLLVFLIAQIWASDKISMAVYEFDASGIKQEDASSVADFVQEGLMQTGRFNLIERKDVQRILKEQMFQKTGCTSTECAVEVGKMLNVSNIIKGKVSKMGSRIIISISLIDVESGKIILTDSVECGNIELLNTGSKKLAEHFSKGVAVKGKVLKTMEDSVIINLGMDDGIKNGDILNVERLGEAIKDDNGKIAFQEKTKVGVVAVKDASTSGSKAQILEGNRSIKNGDIVELKIEKLKPLEPILSSNDYSSYSQPEAEPEQPITYLGGRKFKTAKSDHDQENNEEAPGGFFGTYEFSGNYSFSRENTSGTTTISLSPLGTFNNHFSVGIEFGTSVAEYLSIGNVISFIVPPEFRDLSDVLDENRSLFFFADGIYLRFYPFVGLINPSFSQYKKASQQRGAFQPYISIDGNLYLGIFNPDVNSVFAIQVSSVLLFGLGMDLKAGLEFGNIFYIEFLWRLFSTVSGSTTIYDSNDVELGTQSYTIDLNTMGIGAGFRF